MSEPDRKDAAEKKRLADALRANLRRRKDQARGKREGEAGSSGCAPDAAPSDDAPDGV